MRIEENKLQIYRDPNEEPEPDVYKPTSDKTASQLQASAYEKIVEKLLEYNEKINGGREISVLDYLTRIDGMSSFMKEYDN